jgi:hypothetical protein
VPIILLAEAEDGSIHHEQMASQDIKAFSTSALLDQPFTYPEILDRILLAHSTKRLDSGALFSTDENGFSPYVSAALRSGLPTLFDVFVRVADNEFIRILSREDRMASERVKFYQTLSTSSLYVRTDVQSMSISVTVEHGEEAIAALRSFGATDASISKAKSFLHEVGNLIQTLDPGSDPLMKKLLANLAEHDHSVAITMIASMLLVPLGINSAHGLEIVGIASLAHDIGLSQEAQDLALKDDQDLTSIERKLYHQHPISGARLLKAIPKLDPLVIKAVEQHHERRSKKGFPYQLGAGQIGPFAELIGIADDFAVLLDKQKEGLLSEHPIDILSRSLQTDFSVPTAQSFRKVFRKAA